MADEFDGYGYGHIDAPAAADRMLLWTAPGAGGYSERGEFVWLNSSNGYYEADGQLRVLRSGPGEVIRFGSAAYQMGYLGEDETTNTVIVGNRYTGGGQCNISFRVAGSTEIMRVGTTGVGINTFSSTAFHVKSSNEIARLETTAISGSCYLRFSGPAGSKGFLGYVGDQTFLLNNEVGNIAFGTGGVNRWNVESGLFGPASDNAYDIAWAGGRVRNIYLGNNPVVTCDVRFKAFRPNRQPTEAEHAAALECFDAFGFYQFNDAIEAKGPDGARWHYGPAAQEVWTIFANHGLAAPLGEDGLPPEGSIPPAFLCFDHWDDETAPVLEGWRPSAVLGPDGKPIMVRCGDGEEATEQRPTGETYVTREVGNIFGVRIDQLHSLMLKALNKERKDHAPRIAALEAIVAEDT